MIKIIEDYIKPYESCNQLLEHCIMTHELTKEVFEKNKKLINILEEISEKIHKQVKDEIEKEESQYGRTEFAEGMWEVLQILETGRGFDK